MDEDLASRRTSVPSPFKSQSRQPTYLVGSNFSLADLALMPSFNLLLFVPATASLIRDRENVYRHFNEMSQRRSWQRLITLLRKEVASGIIKRFETPQGALFDA